MQANTKNSRELADFVNQNSRLTLSEVVKAYQQTVEYVIFYLQLYKLNNACTILLKNERISVSIGYLLAKLNQNEQQEFISKALVESPNDFAIEVIQYLSAKKET